MRLAFEYREDREYFRKLLCDPGERLEAYADLFDFETPPGRKRQQAGRICATRKAALSRRFGRRCLLRFADDCDGASGLTVDHLIPLLTNKLNKELRDFPRSWVDAAGVTRKAVSQSFGSNHPRGT